MSNRSNLYESASARARLADVEPEEHDLDGGLYGSAPRDAAAALFDPSAPTRVIANGALYWVRTAAPDCLISGRPDLDAAPPTRDPRYARLLNAGAHRAALLGEFDAQREIAEPEREHLSFDALKALMEQAPTSGGRSGGGGGGRRKREQVVTISLASSGRAVEGPQPGEDDVACLRVRGLTLGEREFYARRGPEEVRVVLRAHVVAMLAGEVRVLTRAERDAAGRHGISVYGLEMREVDHLRNPYYAGSARRALSQHARATEPAWIEAIDRSARRAEKAA